MKKIALFFAALTSTVLLAACGNKLTTTKTTYGQSGMVAVVKGSVSGASSVSYKAATKTGKAKVNNGQFVVSVPVSAAKQTVTLSAAGKTKHVTVKAATALGNYSKIAGTYNQAVIAAALPTSVQKTLRQLQGKKVTNLTPAQQATLAKQQAAVKAAMAKATTATKASQLPTSVDGLKQVLNGTGGKVRVNVQAGQLMAITDIVPMSALKNKAKQQAFGLQFGLLASAVGANAKTVAKQFQSATKNQDSSSTTIKTITSNGVKFDVGFSTTTLFIYITK